MVSASCFCRQDPKSLCIAGAFESLVVFHSILHVCLCLRASALTPNVLKMHKPPPSANVPQSCVRSTPPILLVQRLIPFGTNAVGTEDNALCYNTAQCASSPRLRCGVTKRSHGSKPASKHACGFGRLLVAWYVAGAEPFPLCPRSGLYPMCMSPILYCVGGHLAEQRCALSFTIASIIMPVTQDTRIPRYWADMLHRGLRGSPRPSLKEAQRKKKRWPCVQALLGQLAHWLAGGMWAMSHRTRSKALTFVCNIPASKLVPLGTRIGVQPLCELASLRHVCLPPSLWGERFQQQW